MSRTNTQTRIANDPICKLTFFVSTFCFLLFTGSNTHADLVFSASVTEVGHLLEGATVETNVAGNGFTWESPAGFPAARQYTGNNIVSSWVTTISGATGAGSAWNGSYSVLPVGLSTDTTVVWSEFNQVFAGLVNPNTGIMTNARWTDGTNSFFFNLISGGNSSPPPDGTLVDFTGQTHTLQNFFSLGGSSAPAFSQPTASTAFATVTAVPEPGSTAFASVAGLVLAFRRRRAV